MAGEQLQDYALIVGIDDYSDKAEHPPLQGAKNDALAFMKWLRDVAKVPEANIKPFMLLSDPAGTVPTFSDIIKRVSGLLKLSPTGEERIGRRLYIFFAGHGVGPDIDEAGLVTAESDQFAKLFVPGQRCANTFRAGAFFEEIVLFMDCCRDFDATAPPVPWPFNTAVDPGPADKVKRFYVFAAGFGRKSHEKDFDGTTHGEFSHALIEALKGKASDSNGRITSASVAKHLSHRLSGWKPGVVDPEIVLAEGFQPRLGKVRVTMPAGAPQLKIVTGLGMKPVAAPIKDAGGGVQEIELPVDELFIFQALDAAGKLVNQTSEQVREEGTNVSLV